ncbi:MAG: hypothetical protein CMJ13_01670 [Pelagibacterales bacterium]|nr:hypothetical protein [Pelagibacterales bacterium]
MTNKFIVIFRALGNFPNDELEVLLKKNNYKVITFPILKIVNLRTAPINTVNIQAILVTSSNGLYNLSKLSNNRKIKLFTVGATSKKIAKELGFKNVIDCNGDSVKMFEVVVNNTIADGGYLLYVGAKDISVNLPKMLEGVGYRVKRHVVYRTVELEMLDRKFLSLIKSKQVGWIVLLSKKGALNFNRLIHKNSSLNYLKNVKFACLSSNIAEALSNKFYSKFFPQKPSLNDIKHVILKNE